MASNTGVVLRSSVLRKQVVALTGLAMVGFVIAHLAGNLTIYLGPDAFNGYAAKIASLGQLLWVMRSGLILCVAVHITLTLQLAAENAGARPQPYDVQTAHGDRKFATRSMKYTGFMILAFLALHLYDFTFGNHNGPQSLIEGVEAGLTEHDTHGLFGLVWNSFSANRMGIWRVPVYVVAVMAVGLHLSHAIESVFQTIGLHHERYTPLVKKASLVIGLLVGLGFALIPIYVFIMPTPAGV